MLRKFAAERHRSVLYAGAGALGCVAMLAGCSSTVAPTAQPEAASVRTTGSAGGDSADTATASPPSPSPGASGAESTPNRPSSPSAEATTGADTGEPDAAAAPSGPLTRVLPEASAFPAGYADSATVLPHRDAVAASEDLAGIHRGARTEPVRCQPGSQPPGPDDLAMRSATDPESRSTVAVQLERVGGSLDGYRDTISACTDVTSNRFGAQSTTTRTMIDPPALHGDGDVVAFRQSVRSGDDELVLDQRSTTLAAQVGDVRILVVGMAQNGRPPGADELTGLLRAAVDSVRAG